MKSNRESGDGFADILLKPKNPDAGIIVELKDVRSLHDLNQVCERALEQYHLAQKTIHHYVNY